MAAKDAAIALRHNPAPNAFANGRPGKGQSKARSNEHNEERKAAVPRSVARPLKALDHRCGANIKTSLERAARACPAAALQSPHLRLCHIIDLLEPGLKARVQRQIRNGCYQIGKVLPHDSYNARNAEAQARDVKTNKAAAGDVISSSFSNLTAHGKRSAPLCG